ncbi:MAB_1171c family putative transporter [Amycolatopsis sp. NPDC004079]|uniref:MAB_1171c family putative transporter n=1 Tax=Amycolatopsis sp. NPDC004079 TaxID=3154549 RepID=UPI0033BEC14B
MIEAIGYSGCLGALLAVAAKVESRRPTPPPGIRYLCLFIGCLTAGMTLLAVRGGNTAGLLGDELKLASLAFLVLFARSLSPGEPTRRQVRCALLVTGEMLAVNAVLFAAADAREVDGNTVVNGSGVLPLLIYYVIYTLAATSALSLFIVLIRRYARRMAPGSLRRGLQLIIAGASAGLLWTAWAVEDMYSLLATGRVSAAEDIPSVLLGAVAVTLAAAGATLSAWGPRLGAPVRWLRAYLRYRRLGPLWTMMRKAVPGIVLNTGGGVHLALYRRIIEIRDGHLALREHFDPAVAERAAYIARRTGIAPDRIPAAIEAASIVAALAAHREGRRFGTAADYRPPGLAPTIAAETAWLTAVSRELRWPGTYRLQ